MEYGLTKDAVIRTWKKLLQKLGPYRYAAWILLAGILLILYPGRKEEVTEEPAAVPQTVASLETRLEELLSHVDGAGKVRVVLSMKTGEEYEYQMDRQENNQGDKQDRREETVLVSENGDDKPVVVKTIYPTYKGAVVVCEGADSAAVRLNIVRAVSSLTGLGSDKITVVKMKG